MRKRLITLTLCVVMISAFVTTSAVSATNKDNTINPSIRQYDVLYYEHPNDATGKVVGKVTIDGETGHYIVNVNLGRAGLKDDAQDGQVLWIVLWNTKSFKGIIDPSLGSLEGYGLLIPTFVNAGGIGHVAETNVLIPQWFGDGAVDQAPTDARFDYLTT